MANICNLSTIKQEVKKFVTFYLSQERSEHNAAEIRSIISERFPQLQSNMGITAIVQELEKNGIHSGLENTLEYQKQNCSSLQSITLQDPTDTISVFKANQKGVQFVLKIFSKQAFKNCILNISTLNNPNPFVGNDSQLQSNIVTWKNSLIKSMLRSAHAAGFQNIVSEILSEAGVEDINNIVVFSLESGADDTLYYSIMNKVKSAVSNEDGIVDVSTHDFDSLNSALTNVLYNLIALNNFDFLLESTMEDVIKPNRRDIGNLHRTNYSLVYSLDGSQQDLMGVSDYDYENALNYISVSLEKIINNIPMISVSLAAEKERGKRFIADPNAQTLQISHVLQASTWLQQKLPDLAKYLNIPNSDLLSNPSKVMYSAMKQIHDFISYEWDSKEDHSDIVIGLDLENSRNQVKKILKGSGVGLNTLMSLYEFLFNTSDRINRRTMSILDIQNMSTDRAPKFNIIADITSQMIASMAPAIMEHNMDGTVWDQERPNSPISVNYIQKALRNKISFSFKSYVRKSIFFGLKNGDAKLFEDISEVSKKNTNLKDALKDQKYIRAIGSIFGVNPEQFETLSSLLLDAEQEHDKGNSRSRKVLFNMFKQIAAEVTRLKAQSETGKLSSLDQYFAVNQAVTTAMDALDIDILGRALSPLLSSAPTPTFYDRLGNQLGVYRTTSLVFMFPHLVNNYKKNIEDPNVGLDGYIPLRQRCNILADKPELLQMGSNQLYESTVAIPLSMGNEEVNLEARKQPEFIQDLRQFMGEFMSLVNARTNKGDNPMMGVQLGTYSDKTTLPQLMFNLMQTFGKDHSLIQMFLGDSTNASAKMRCYSLTQKFDLVDKILSDWQTIFTYIQNNIATISSEWKLTNKEQERLEAILTSNDLKNFLLYGTRVREMLTSTEYSDAFKNAVYPERVIGNDALDNSDSSQFDLLSDEIYQHIQNAVSNLNNVLSQVPTANKFNLRILNRAAFDTNVQLVDKLYYDKYPKIDPETKKKISNYQLNGMVLEDLDIAYSKSVISNNETSASILKILNEIEEAYDDPKAYEVVAKKVEQLSYPTQMVISALSKQYYINGKKMSYFAYLKQYFKKNNKLMNNMLNLRHSGIGKDIFGKMFTENGGVYKFDDSGIGLIEVYRQYLQMNNFLRHSALDVSIKEAYEDKGASLDKAAERYIRQLTTSKRNNTMTAPVIPFNLSLLNGVNQDGVNMVIVEDLPGGVFNTIGIKFDLDEYDGCGWTAPIQARQESASLGEKSHTPVKKTFITPVHDYYAEELKWASNELTNQLIRESQGSEVDLLKIYKKMHSFDINYDITKLYTGQQGRLRINLLLGSKYYAKEGFKYYQYTTITSVGKNTYQIERQEVDKHGNVILDESGRPMPKELVKINGSSDLYLNSIYDIYMALNGVNGMSLVNGTLEYSESIHDFTYALVTNVGQRKTSVVEKGELLTQEEVEQPLRDKFIHIFATNSANKRGAANVTPNTIWTDPENTPMYYTKISLATGGKQLDAEHESDKSRITKGTQLLQDLAQKGYTSDLVTSVYEAIARAMSVSSEAFNEIEHALHHNVDALPELIAKRVTESIELQGNSLEIQTLISAFKQQSEENNIPFTLPLSLLTKEVIKSIAPELNHVIKQKDSGLMGVLNAASGFVQVYNLNGNTYTYGQFLSDELVRPLLPYRARIENYAETRKISVEEVVRLLNIIRLNSGMGDMNSELFAVTKPGDDNMFLMLDLIRSDQVEFNQLNDIQKKFKKKNFLCYELINPAELQPGDWYIDDSSTIKKVDNPELLQDLILNGKTHVYLCKHKPVDLKPQALQIVTDTYSENEYTSYEAVYDRFIKEAISNDGVVSTVPAVLSLVHYLRSVNNNKFELDDNILNWKISGVELQYLQEDMVNFKNHIKSFGYTLKKQPLTQIDLETKKVIDIDFNSYYGGFDPTKDFEQQLQEKIIEQYSSLAPDGTPLYPEKLELIIQGLQFASQAGKLSQKKKDKLKSVLRDQGVLALCKENPWFVFSVLPESKQALYKEYMDSRPDIFAKIKSRELKTAQIIMPPIYKEQMGIGNRDISQIDLNYFRKGNTFYRLQGSIVGENSIDADFVVRTFRGNYNIVVSKDLNTDQLKAKYGNPVQIEVKNGNRISPRNQKVMYKLPQSPYVILKDGNGVETIVIKDTTKSFVDIYELINSDSNVVTIEPFVKNILTGSKQQQLSRLLQQLRDLNTLPVFESMYDTLISLTNGVTSDMWGQYIAKNKAEILSNLKKDHFNLEETYKEMYAQSMYQSFLRSLDMIATRIPTQNMSSIMPMRVASLLNSSVNNVFVTKWQQWLQGSDYDIDKAFLLGYNFDEKGMFIRWSNQQKFYTPALFEASLKLPLPTGQVLDMATINNQSIVDPYVRTLVLDYIALHELKSGKLDNKKLTKLISSLAQKYEIPLSESVSQNANLIDLILFEKIVTRVNQVGGLYPSSTYKNTASLSRLVDRINSHNSFLPKVEGINNYSTYITHQVLNDPRNATTTYKSIDVATKAFSDPIDRINWNQRNGNIDDGHTISQTTASGAVGKDGVGIGANGTKVYFTLLNYFNRNLSENPPLDMDDLIESPFFNISKIQLSYVDMETKEEKEWVGNVGPIADSRLNVFHTSLYTQFLDRAFGENKHNGLYLYNRDAAQDVGALLSMAADNAKTLNLDKLHADTDYFAMHIYLAMIGVPPRVIIGYFNSPAFLDVIHKAQNDLTMGRIPEVSAKSFPDPQMKQIFLAAKEISSLAQILSINQGIKVEEEEIISQRSKCEQIYSSTLMQRGVSSEYFGIVDYKGGYVPDNKVLRNICEIGKENPIITKGQEQVIRKMQVADAAMKEVGITLKTDFDFNRFLTDEKYANAIVAIFDVIKYNFNVFDVVKQAPHFYQMLKSYNNVLQAYSKVDKQLDFELNIAPDIYDSSIVNVDHPTNSDYKMKVSKTFTKKQIKAAKGYFYDLVLSQFISEEIRKHTFSYVPKQGKEIKCSFYSDNSLHNFVEFVNSAIIPTLLETHKDNQFLLGLEINDLEVTTNGNLFFSFSENLRSMGHKDFSGESKLHNIKEDFDKIRNIKISDLLKSKGSLMFAHSDQSNVTVGDVLYLYNTLMKIASPAAQDFSSLFDSMNVPGTWKFRYAEFVKSIDLTDVSENRFGKLHVSPHGFMAYLYKNQAFTHKETSGRLTKKISFTDGSKDQIFRISEKDSKGTLRVSYNRYLVSMPYIQESITQSQLNSETFLSAILNKVIVFKDRDNEKSIDLNCIK